MLSDDHAATEHYAEIIKILDRADRELLPEDYEELLSEVEMEASERYDESQDGDDGDSEDDDSDLEDSDMYDSDLDDFSDED